MKASRPQEIFWQTLSSVPAGRVATYGQIARLAGFPNHARYVGATLKNLPKDTKLPWHRIINSKGEIVFPEGSSGFKKQVKLLTNEGVTIVKNRINLRLYQWQNYNKS